MGLDAVELVMAIEEEFGIDIADAESETLPTPRALIDFLWAKHQRGELFIKPPPRPGLLQRIGWGKPPEHRQRQVLETREVLAGRVRDIIKEQTGVGQFADDDRFFEDMNIG